MDWIGSRAEGGPACDTIGFQPSRHAPLFSSQLVRNSRSSGWTYLKTFASDNLSGLLKQFDQARLLNKIETLNLFSTRLCTSTSNALAGLATHSDQAPVLLSVEQ
jgi:hypothetical protein